MAPYFKKYNKTTFNGSQVHSCIQTDLFYSKLRYIYLLVVFGSQVGTVVLSRERITNPRERAYSFQPDQGPFCCKALYKDFPSLKALYFC